VPTGAKRTSTVDRRFAAVAPDSHCALSEPFTGELAMTGLSPRSSSILSRFGITVSTLRVLWNDAPPTVAVAFQLPVGASAAVLSSKA